MYMYLCLALLTADIPAMLYPFMNRWRSEPGRCHLPDDWSSLLTTELTPKQQMIAAQLIKSDRTNILCVAPIVSIRQLLSSGSERHYLYSRFQTETGFHWTEDACSQPDMRTEIRQEQVLLRVRISQRLLLVKHPELHVVSECEHKATGEKCLHQVIELKRLIVSN